MTPTAASDAGRHAPSRAIRHALATVALLLSASALPGCAILDLGDAGHEDGTASLSDAAREAASDSTKKKRPLDVGYTTPPTGVEVEVGGGSGESLAPESGDAMTVKSVERQRLIWGAVFEFGAFGGQDYDGYGGGGLSLGSEVTDHVRVDLVGLATSVNFSGEGKLGDSFENGLDLKLELQARYDLSPTTTFMSVAPIVALGTGTLFWDYAHPLPIVENGVPRTVTSDQINFFYADGGVSVALARWRHMVLDARVVAGARFYGWHTDSGFSNDLLGTTGFAQLQIGVAFR